MTKLKRLMFFGPLLWINLGCGGESVESPITKPESESIQYEKAKNILCNTDSISLESLKSLGVANDTFYYNSSFTYYSDTCVEQMDFSLFVITIDERKNCLFKHLFIVNKLTGVVTDFIECGYSCDRDIPFSSTLLTYKIEKEEITLITTKFLPRDEIGKETSVRYYLSKIGKITEVKN